LLLLRRRLTLTGARPTAAASSMAIVHCISTRSLSRYAQIEEVVTGIGSFRGWLLAELIGHHVVLEFQKVSQCCQEIENFT